MSSAIAVVFSAQNYKKFRGATTLVAQLLRIRLSVQYQKNKQPNPKMGRRPKQTFLQRRYTDCQQTHERMLNITDL